MSQFMQLAAQKWRFQTNKTRYLNSSSLFLIPNYTLIRAGIKKCKADEKLTLSKTLILNIPMHTFNLLDISLSRLSGTYSGTLVKTVKFRETRKSLSRLSAGNWQLSDIFHPVSGASSFNWFLWNLLHPLWPTKHTVEPDRLLTPNTWGPLSVWGNHTEKKKTGGKKRSRNSRTFGVD